MKKRIAWAVVSLLVAIGLYGCGGGGESAIPPDTAPPVLGNLGTITTSGVSSTSITLNWTEASDNVTAQSSLQYLAYLSTSANIDTEANIEANGTAIGTYATGIATVNVTSVAASTTYYFNVIVRDAAGNKAAYTMKAQATTAASAVPTVTSISPSQGLSTAITPSVQIAGTNFNGATVIKIGSSIVPNGSCTFNSPTSITCAIPGSGSGSTFGQSDVTADNGSGLTGTLTNGWRYIGVLNETDVILEADYCIIQTPSSITVATGVTTGNIYGQIYEAGVSESAGASASVSAQVGYGPSGTDPATAPTGWTYVSAAFNLQSVNNDEYVASFIAPSSGSYSYVFRFSLDNGASYTYCDLDGAGSNQGFVYSPTQLGSMTVSP